MTILDDLAGKLRAVREAIREHFDAGFARIDAMPGAADDPAKQDAYGKLYHDARRLEREMAELASRVQAAWEAEHKRDGTSWIYEVTGKGGTQNSFVVARDDEELFKLLASAPRTTYRFHPPNFAWEKVGIASPAVNGGTGSGFLHCDPSRRIATTCTVPGCVAGRSSAMPGREKNDGVNANPAFKNGRPGRRDR